MQIRTKDADQAAFLWTLDNVDLQKIQKSQGYRKIIIYFVFETSLSEQQVSNILSDYKNGKTLVEPKKYAWKRGQIRQIIKQNIY